MVSFSPMKTSFLFTSLVILSIQFSSLSRAQVTPTEDSSAETSQQTSQRDFLSAVRNPLHHFDDIAKDHQLSRNFAQGQNSKPDAGADGPSTSLDITLNTPFDLRTSIKKISALEAPLSASLAPSKSPWQEWTSKDTPLEAFKKIRDQRVLRGAGSLFDRRPTWLYPDDGCFARAEIAAQELIDLGYPVPNKIFAFGDLEVTTHNNSSGYVTWWYHVVPGYKYKGQIIVFDPAIEPQKPLLLSEWVRRMSGRNTSDVEVAVCDNHAIDPDSLCFAGEAHTKASALELQKPYLELEWNRLEELGRNPFSELGENPPWKN